MKGSSNENLGAYYTPSFQAQQTGLIGARELLPHPFFSFECTGDAEAASLSGPRY